MNPSSSEALRVGATLEGTKVMGLMIITITLTSSALSGNPTTRILGIAGLAIVALILGTEWTLWRMRREAGNEDGKEGGNPWDLMAERIILWALMAGALLTLPVLLLAGAEWRSSQGNGITLFSNTALCWMLGMMLAKLLTRLITG